MAFTLASSRRSFVTQLGRVASLTALGSLVATRAAVASETPSTPEDRAPGDWDFSWLDQLKDATNRGVFDWSTMPTPPEATPLDYAARYLDGCAAAYGDAAPARAVVVIRHEATPAALTDAAWKRYDIGAVVEVTDPLTHRPAVRNPFWSGDPHDTSAAPTLQSLSGRGVIVLACNMALTHVAERIARARGDDPATVHQVLRASLVPNGFAVPSGIFGLVRAQNAGCGLVRA